MSRAEPHPGARRADAARNRDKILATARDAFAEVGGEISMAEIARRADVGMATLYRHFPSRRELLEALYTNEVDAICEAAGNVVADTPDAALAAWLRRFFAFITSKQPVGAELLKHSKNTAVVMSESRRRVTAAGRPLLLAAQQRGVVREDVTLEQVLDLIVAIASIRGEPDYLEPILQSALDGLRAPRDKNPPMTARRPRSTPTALAENSRSSRRQRRSP